MLLARPFCSADLGRYVAHRGVGAFDRLGNVVFPDNRRQRNHAPRRNKQSVIHACDMKSLYRLLVVADNRRLGNRLAEIDVQAGAIVVCRQRQAMLLRQIGEPRLQRLAQLVHSLDALRGKLAQ